MRSHGASRCRAIVHDEQLPINIESAHIMINQRRGTRKQMNNLGVIVRSYTVQGYLGEDSRIHANAPLKPISLFGRSRRNLWLLRDRPMHIVL